MSLEAAAGKNPVTHVGKIYNVAAQDIARWVVAGRPEVVRAECLLVSQIGAPINQPAVAEVRAELHADVDLTAVRAGIAQIVADTLNSLPARIEDFVAGRVGLF
jgi:S-adenosylmethionine synthetase